jgi:hypothetical protein
MPMCIFSLNKPTNLGSSTCGIGIGFKSHGTCDTINMTIGATTLGCTHPISSSEEAKALPCSESISWNFFFSYLVKKSPPPIFTFSMVSLINLKPIFLVSFNPGSIPACLMCSLVPKGN